MKNLKFIFLILSIFFVGCSTNVDKNTKPVVGVTTFALYDVASHISNGDIDIINIIPFGVDPHSFEPTPKLMVKIEKSNLVFYSGAGLEPWVDKFDFKNKAINLSRYVTLRKLSHEDEHHHNAFDPHYWLNFKNMEIIAKIITSEFIKLNPKNKALYEDRKDKYISMLNKLDRSYHEKLQHCKADTVIVSHNALGYLADRYGFHVESLSGLSPEAQPSAKDVTRIMQDIKSKNINSIFFEHFTNDKLIKSIAKDSGVSLDVFQPLGNITKDEANAKLTYEDIMKQNLKKLSKALVCN